MEGLVTDEPFSPHAVPTVKQMTTNYTLLVAEVTALLNIAQQQVNNKSYFAVCLAPFYSTFESVRVPSCICER